MSENLANWPQPYLNDLCIKITDGAHYSPATDINGLPIATVENMLSSSFDIASCRKISKNEFEDLKRNNCQPLIGDVLFSKDGTIGKTFVFNQNTEVVLLSSIAIIRTKSQELDPGYCSFFLESPNFYTQLETIKSGSALKRVVLGDIKKIKIPLPSLLEQKKIAEILTLVDKVIELTEIEIEKLKNLKKGLMQDLLTKGIGHTKFKDSPIGKIPESWESITIKDVTNLITKGATPTTYGHDFVSYGIKFYRGVNATHDGRASLNDLKYISEEANEMLRRSSLAENDFVISIVGAPGETSFFVTKEMLPGNINQNVAIVRCDSTKVDPVFIKNWFQSSYFKAQKDIEVTTQAQPSLSLGQIGAFKLHLPSLPEQKKIVGVFLSIDKTIESKEHKLERSKNMKKGLMQDLLTGKVRVKV